MPDEHKHSFRNAECECGYLLSAHVAGLNTRLEKQEREAAREMTDEYLVDLTLQLYARATSSSCSQQLHERAMELRVELLRRLATRERELAEARENLKIEESITQMAGARIADMEAQLARVARACWDIITS